ncbi:MAG TPA: transglutaminase-like domain-containing protein [Acidimicrobiales bacterium]|nr:transglutaminase-like domain-containing protein [Acidimicrobiales bacterium]
MTSTVSSVVWSATDAGIVADLTLLAVALGAGLGAARLIRAPTTERVLVPITACVVTGHLVVSLVRRLRLPDPLPSLVGVLGVALAAVWTLIPGSTRAGLPTATTVRVLLDRFNSAGTAIRSHPTPVPATSGVILCLAAGAGLAAVFARTLWSWQESRSAGSRRPMLALVPTFGLFCYTALLSSDIARVVGATLYLATAPLFLAAADRPTLRAVRTDERPGETDAQGDRHGGARGGRRRPKRSWIGSGAPLAFVITAVAVVVPLAASPALGGLRLDAIPFSGGGGPGGPGGAGGVGGNSGQTGPGIGALDLIDNMRSVLTSRSDLVMFDAVSPTPTYWQVASLTRFDGTSWVPDRATEAAAKNAPLLSPQPTPSLTEPTSTKTFSVQVTIAGLRTILLPVPPDTITVSNAIAIQLEHGIGVIQPFSNSADVTYDATAETPTSVGDRAVPTVAALDASQPSTALEPYLALPSSIPARVVRLAHQVVTRTTTPDAAAAALVRYFTTGKRFRYTVTPPPVEGSNALASFLLRTRAGFCQQFAGAFAVLARIDGLPTRIAVGFTTGLASASNRDHYTVTGADAHSWPEVYLGPNAGWVSFEPTPASTDEQLGAGVQNGTNIALPSAGVLGATTTTQPAPHSGHGFSLSAAARHEAAATRFAHRSSRSSASAPWGDIVLAALGAVAVVWAGTMIVPWLWRRRRPRLRRRRFSPTRAPTAEIVARWRQAEAVLARTGLGRWQSETPEEHAGRLAVGATRGTSTPAWPFLSVLGSSPSPDTPVGQALEAYAALAVLAARASYSPDPCTEEDRAEARRQCEALRRALSRRRSPGRRGSPRHRVAATRSRDAMLGARATEPAGGRARPR